MLTDAQVKEIAYLREYASILRDFKDYISGSCEAINKKAKSVLEDVGRISRDAEVLFNNNQLDAERLIRDFNSIVDNYQLSNKSKPLLGDSVDKTQEVMEKIRSCSDDIKKTVDLIKSQIDFLSERTKKYSDQIEKKAENGSVEIKERCDLLEKYKDTK